MGEVLKEETGKSHSMIIFLEKKLTGLGYKFTGQRRIILEALCNENKLFDSESIFMMAKKIDPSIGIATVYRTL